MEVKVEVWVQFRVKTLVRLKVMLGMNSLLEIVVLVEPVVGIIVEALAETVVKFGAVVNFK